MPNEPGPDVRQAAPREDARATRSIEALRHALSSLLSEHDFRTITVQQIIDRAGVGRATFYAHYRNKDDVLLASFEGMLTGIESRMDHGTSPRGRLVPLAELLTHFAGAGPVFDSLRNSDRLDAIWSLGTDLIADLIQRRLPLVGAPLIDERVTTRMLAGACTEMIRWWLDHQREVTPALLDAQFHALARRLLAVRT